MSTLDKKMKEMFIDEGKELLQTLEQQFSQLEDDPEDSEAILEIYRTFHTFKGMTGTVGLTTLSTLFHKLENIIQEIRDKKAKVTKGIITLLFQSLDLIENILSDFGEKDLYDEGKVQKFLDNISATNEGNKKTGDDQEESLRRARIREIFEQYGLEEIDSSRIQFDEKGQKYYNITIELVQDVKLKTTRVLVIIKNLIGNEDPIGKIILSSPAIVDLVEGKFDQEFSLLFQSQNSMSKIKDRINLSDEIAGVKINEIRMEEARNQVKESEEQAQMQKDLLEFKRSAKITSIRVEVNKLDELMEVIGELLINTKRLQQETTENQKVEVKNQIQAIQNLVLILQDDILQMQLIPVNTIFRRFPRMVRSLSLQESKDVKMNISGAEMLVDRKILDEINEALVHLIRNAVSHGIEQTQDRLKNKKSQVGTITLAARREKNMLAIDVIDDGAGINPGKIKEIAMKKGLLNEEETRNFTLDDAYRVIFKPGFSTMAVNEISETSGRGIGLNIVREKVEKLGGIINITSKVGYGTTFTIFLPLSMSIIKALLVRVGSEKFSIPLDDVQYIYNFNQSELQDINGMKFMNIQGTNIPVYDLGQIFNIQSSDKPRLLDQQFVNVALIERGNRKFGLAVEEFLEQTEIVVKRVEELTRHVKGVSGATILANGAVSLILDPFTIVSF